MAIPEIYAGANVNPDTHTWAALINRTNQLSDHMATLVVTVNATAVGGQTNGNAQVNGIFGSTVLATPTLRGGTVSTPGLLTVTSNIQTNEHVAFLGSKNITAVANNVAVTAVNSNSNVTTSVYTGTNYTLTAANLNLTGSTSFNLTGNVVSNGGFEVRGLYLRANSMFEVSTTSNLTSYRHVNATAGLNTTILTTSNQATIGGNLTVNGVSVALTGMLTATTTGNLTVARPMVAQSTLRVEGAQTVIGAATFSNTVTASGSAFTVNVTGAAAVTAATVALTGTTSVTGGIDANRQVVVTTTTSTLRSGGATIVATAAANTIVLTSAGGITATTNSFGITGVLTANVAGNIDVVRPVNLTQTLSTNAVSVGSTLQVTGTTTLSGSLSVAGPTALNANVSITANTFSMADVFTFSRTGNATFSRPLVASAATTLSAVTINGTASILGNVTGNSTSIAWNDIFESSKTTDFVVHRPFRTDQANVVSLGVSGDIVAGGMLYVNGGINIASNISLAVNDSVANTITVMSTANIARLTGTTVADVIRFGPRTTVLPTEDGSTSFVPNRGLVVYRANASPAGTYTVWDTSNVLAGDNISITGGAAGALTGRITLAVTGGPGSGLHADLLDGQEGSYYLNAANMTGTLPGTVFPTNVVLTTGNQTIAGTKTFSSTIVGSVNGSAARLTTARTINGTSFDGTANIVLPSMQVTENNSYVTSRPILTHDVTPANMSGVDNTTHMGIHYATSKILAQGSTGTIFASHFNMVSDERKKKNIRVIDRSLEKLETLRGVDFNWKDNGDASMGVIAQEVQKVFPAAVANEDNQLTVSYGSLIGPMIEAIKELSSRVRQLEAQLNAK